MSKQLVLCNDRKWCLLTNWQSWPQQKLEDVELDSTFAGKLGDLLFMFLSTWCFFCGYWYLMSITGISLPRICTFFLTRKFTDKVDLSKNWKTLIWIPPLQGNQVTFFLKILNKYFRFKFLPTWCPFLWILISFLHHWVHKDLLFLEAVFFSHPEIFKRLKSADYIRWVKMSRRGGRRLKPSVGGRPVMSTVQKILCSSILIQTLCVKGRQVLGLFANCGGFDSKAASQRQGICHSHFAFALCVKPQ